MLVVGQGLAGTALAWQLRRRNVRFLVVDQEAPDSASRVAAGLLTPVTGQRLAPVPQYAERLATATDFYRRIEAITDARFFQTTGAVRLFLDVAERERYIRRSGAGLDPPVSESLIAPHGAFAMPTAARLATEPYLLASRRVFAAAGQYQAASLDVARDLDSNADGICIPRLGVQARRVVWCVGAAIVPGFPTARPDAGEVLTVRIEGLTESRTIHRGVWLAPLGDDRFRVGATYVVDQSDPTPTAAGRTDLLDRLAAAVRRPVTVEDHRAGLRPVTVDHQPLIAVHPAYPQMWCFTGLGSKGALTAPTAADELADRILTGVPAVS